MGELVLGNVEFPVLAIANVLNLFTVPSAYFVVIFMT